MEEILKEIHEVSMKLTALDLPDKFSVYEFINRDESLPTGETLTTLDIRDLVLNEEKEEFEISPEKIVEKTISNLTAKFHLEELKYYFSNLNDFDSEDIRV